MPQLTISMPVLNEGCHIRSALDRILRQANVEFELVVVDRGSTDDSVAIIESFSDSRIKLIRANRNISVGACHNLVFRQCSSPFLATMNSRVLLLPGAFEKFVSFFGGSPATAMVQSYFYGLTEGKIESRERFHKRQEKFSKVQENHTEWLLVHGSFPGSFRIYRTEAVKNVGGFHEKIRDLEEYDLSLRILDRFEIKILPEFLYCIDKSIREKAPRGESLSMWDRRVSHVSHLIAAGKVRLPDNTGSVLNSLFFKSFLQTTLWLAFARILSRGRDQIVNCFRNLWSFLSLKIYYSLLPHLSWWPIQFFRFGGTKQSSSPKRIAYYTWHFPVLSQTFIGRELSSLVNSGFYVRIVADEAEDLESSDVRSRSLLKNTSYLYPMDSSLLKRYRKFFFRRNPFRYCNLLLFVLTHNYGRYKKPHMDREVFWKAVYLAGVLKDDQIDHIHSPWADLRSFTVLVASRLLGISYSVQGRAHDLHRHIHHFAFREKFENAKFIITNSRYNHAHIKTRLWKNCDGKLHTIYEGLDPDEFVPSSNGHGAVAHPRILCVARLIEAKGLVVLLEACKILKEEGFRFRCEIIGAPEGPSYINYFLTLMKLHSKLGLADSVFFLGAIPLSDVLKKYQEADIFVLPCIVAEDGTQDITPNSLIEAMAMKLPVISTTITAIPEIVEDGVNGLLVPPGNKKALADAISKLMKNDQLRKALGEKAREKVEEKFDIRKNIDGYVSLFSGKT